MANGIYTGAGGVRREVTELHTGVGGTKRSVKEGYVGVGGARRQFYTVSFEWGENDGLGDEKWWLGLRRYLARGGDSSSFVGMKKRVLLNKAVCGWAVGAKVSMTCIGVNIDADNSATFQTTGCSPDSTFFCSSGYSPLRNEGALWANSWAKTLCEDFATNCSASGAVKQITKLNTTVSDGGSHDHDADVETLCKGFLPSDCEMGFSGYHLLSSSDKEWTKGRTGTPYPYYSSNAMRIKTRDWVDGTSDDDYAVPYWERSRYYYGPAYVCVVEKGGYNGEYANNEYNIYLAPAFVIGV